MKRKFKKLWRWLAVFAVLFAIATGFQKNSGQSSEASTNSIAKIFNQFSQFSSQNTSHGQQLPAPTEDEAKVVLTSAVRNQLPANLSWNGHGAYIVNNNHPQLNAQISSAPYAVNHVDVKGRAWRGDAWLNHSTRQYQNREQTGNGATNWRPAGFLQATNLTNGPRHALGYALVGGIKGFNASESNPQNIATQTAWANEARSSNSTGQNYYEGLVRKALDQNKQVRYRVTNIYDGNCVVPAGAHIEALSKDGSLSFNVFIPNVQNNISIDYATGAVAKR